jgi:hypothetical protein
MKDFQATGETSSHLKRSLQNMNILPFLWVVFACLILTRIQKLQSRSTDPIKSGSFPDLDPKHRFKTTVLCRYSSNRLKNFIACTVPNTVQYVNYFLGILLLVIKAVKVVTIPFLLSCSGEVSISSQVSMRQILLSLIVIILNFLIIHINIPIGYKKVGGDKPSLFPFIHVL